MSGAKLGRVKDSEEPNAWLLMAVGDNRQHGGNAGYDDQVDVYYTWDSTVPNHAKIRQGDRIALWDKERLLGLSVVEEIGQKTKDKLLYKCPKCGKAGIKARRGITPLYKCYKCHAKFDLPTSQTVTVTEYRSRHDAAWTSLDGLVDGAALRTLCAAPRSQLSIRSLRWDAFRDALEGKGAIRAVERVNGRRVDTNFADGHRLDIVRVRRGQGKFREHLLASQGQICAFTGSAPARVLEAGHLYSYAQLGVHHRHGGLLFRRDIHRLFDDGWLAVNPETLRVDVVGQLAAYPQYSALHDQLLRAEPSDGQVTWLIQHWNEHRMS